MMTIVNSQHIMKLTPKAAGGQDFVGFSKLSCEKPNMYAFLNRRVEYDDDDVLACEQYLLGFITTDKTLSQQSMIVQVVTDFLINLLSAHQVVQ